MGAVFSRRGTGEPPEGEEEGGEEEVEGDPLFPSSEEEVASVWVVAGTGATAPFLRGVRWGTLDAPITGDCEGVMVIVVDCRTGAGCG